MLSGSGVWMGGSINDTYSTVCDHLGLDLNMLLSMLSFKIALTEDVEERNLLILEKRIINSAHDELSVLLSLFLHCFYLMEICYQNYL